VPEAAGRYFRKAVEHMTAGRPQGLPVAVRHAGQQTLILQCTPTRPDHVRLGPRFVDEHEPIRIQERLLPLEFVTPLRDVRPLPLRGDEHVV